MFSKSFSVSYAELSMLGGPDSTGCHGVRFPVYGDWADTILLDCCCRPGKKKP